MLHTPTSPRLTFEDAVSVHVLRAHGTIFSELTRIFGANPARFHEILCGDLFPGSWEEAVQRLAAGECWTPDISNLIDAHGRERVLASVMAASPAKKKFERQRKRFLKSSPISIRLLRIG